MKDLHILTVQSWIENKPIHSKVTMVYLDNVAEVASERFWTW